MAYLPKITLSGMPPSLKLTALRRFAHESRPFPPQKDAGSFPFCHLVV